MKKVSDLDRMKELIGRLNAASDNYYNGLPELMSDHEWDALFDELLSLEKSTGQVLPDSPTANVSRDDTAGKKVEHEYPALSLAKTKDVNELYKWAENRPIWLSWKLDGLTLVATYDDGKLSRLATRGNGHVGTDITHLSDSINGVLPKIDHEGHLVIRGEAVISYKDFEEFMLESKEDYANPRNLASGSLSLKDKDEVKRRRINFIPFTLVHCDEEIVSWGERMERLSSLGFQTVERELISEPSLSNISDAIKRWTLNVTSNENPYPVDGLVAGYDDTVYAAGGSVTGHHATRAGFAFKWADESVDTPLSYIEWSCAAGSITPVAVFEPVALEGTTVKRASLCNISECERLSIGDKGSILSVIKANKIIPKVIAVKEKKGELIIPDTCPVCGEKAYVRVSEISKTKTLRCSNEKCPAKQLRKFSRFVSKDGMDIEGISEMTLQRFVNLGWISDLSDILRLPDHREEIALLDGFGEKSADNIKASVEKAMTVDAEKFLFSLSIPLVGQDVAKRLLSGCTLTELFKTAEETDDEKVFSGIEGIGPEKSTSFVRWAKDGENQAVLSKLLSLVTIREKEKTPAGEKCKGLTFVITGDVFKFKNRNEVKAYIESQGGTVTGSVSKKTSFLINNDINSTSNKNQKARELSIPIISEDEFIERFKETLS